MNRIIGDFMKRELGSLVGIILVYALLIGLLFYLGADMLKWLPLVLAVLAAMVLRLFSTATWDFRTNWREMQWERQQRIAEEYESEHLVLPVYLGEVHILTDCLIWRSRRRLVLVLAEDIERVRLVRLDKVWDLVFATAINKRYKLEFLGGQRQNVEQVLAWLRGLSERIGKKVDIES